MNLLETKPNKEHPTPVTKIWNVPDDHPTITNNPYQLGLWVVYAPWMHMAWHSYLVSLVHLRSDAGEEPPILQFPVATHEFMVFALAPDEPIDLDKPPPVLHPYNLCQQLEAKNDAEALEAITILLGRVLVARLSLDSDYRRQWKHLLKDHTIEDLRKANV